MGGGGGLKVVILHSIFVSGCDKIHSEFCFDVKDFVSLNS